MTSIKIDLDNPGQPITEQDKDRIFSEKDKIHWKIKQSQLTADVTISFGTVGNLPLEWDVDNPEQHNGKGKDRAKSKSASNIKGRILENTGGEEGDEVEYPYSIRVGGAIIDPVVKVRR